MAACAAPPQPDTIRTVETSLSSGPLTLDRAARSAARRQATAALRAYARPDRGSQAWWAHLRPHLSETAQTAYAGTDPRRIPVESITGPARLTPASLAALARVAIPTEDGIYLLLLSRTSDQRWAVERIIAPEAGSR